MLAAASAKPLTPALSQREREFWSGRDAKILPGVDEGAGDGP
jgi:hypothetical protein